MRWPTLVVFIVAVSFVELATEARLCIRQSENLVSWDEFDSNPSLCTTPGTGWSMDVSYRMTDQLQCDSLNVDEIIYDCNTQLPIVRSIYHMFYPRASYAVEQSWTGFSTGFHKLNCSFADAVSFPSAGISCSEPRHYMCLESSVSFTGAPANSPTVMPVESIPPVGLSVSPTTPEPTTTTSSPTIELTASPVTTEPTTTSPTSKAPTTMEPTTTSPTTTAPTTVTPTVGLSASPTTPLSTDHPTNSPSRSPTIFPSIVLPHNETSVPSASPNVTSSPSTEIILTGVPSVSPIGINTTNSPSLTTNIPSTSPTFVNETNAPSSATTTSSPSTGSPSMAITTSPTSGTPTSSPTNTQTHSPTTSSPTSTTSPTHSPTSTTSPTVSPQVELISFGFIDADAFHALRPEEWTACTGMDPCLGCQPKTHSKQRIECESNSNSTYVSVLEIPNVGLTGELDLTTLRRFSNLSVLNLRNENQINPNTYVLPNGTTCVDLEYCVSNKTTCYFNEPIHVCSLSNAQQGDNYSITSNGVIAISLTSLLALGVIGAVLLRRTDKGRRLSMSISNQGRKMSRRLSTVPKNEPTNVGPAFLREEIRETNQFQVRPITEREVKSLTKGQQYRRSRGKNQSENKMVSFTVINDLGDESNV